MEKSVLMIKPEGMNHRDEIMAFIEKGGLKITRFRTMVLTEDELRKIYHDTSGEIWEKTKKAFLGKEVFVAEVEGGEAIDKLKNICGTNTDPVACDVGSVRNFFREIAPRYETPGYHQNIIHRALGEKEVEDQTLIFFERG